MKLHNCIKSCFFSKTCLVFLCIIFICIFAEPIYGQQEPGKEITGLVTDTSGAILSGVSVYSKKDSHKGTFTDRNGKFVLTVPDQALLVFSMTGYDSVEVRVGDSSFYNVELHPAMNDLQDAVVIAFGREKKADVVGAVVSVNPSELKVPSSNLTTALAGRVPGMIAFQRSGEPGADNANFFVRGVTTFGYKTDPLILIDGVEVTTTDLARLQVDDVQSFSVLKDATATALYGSRAANGVILITTKQGKIGVVHVSFRAENSVSQPTQDVELADPVTYMKLSNEATLTRDPLAPTLYSDEKIEKTALGVNPIIFPANDWRKIMFKDHTVNQRFNLSLSGGGGVAQYYVSGAFNRDNGLMKVDHRNNFNSNIALNSYSLRSNVDINVTKSTKLTVRLSGSFDDYKGPISGNNDVSAGTDMYNRVMHANPVLFPAYYPADAEHSYIKHIMFGNYDQGQYINPYADMVKGYKEYSRSQLNAQLDLNQDLYFLAKGLTFNALMNISRYSYFDISRQYNPFWSSLAGYNLLTNTYYLKDINPDGGTEYLDYSEGQKDLSTTFNLQARLNYSHSFGDMHNLSGMLVYMMENRLTANAGSLQLSLPNRNLGVSGRFTYDYDKRYYAEFNFGYNGSERFDQDHRFGFFPSAGVAWTVSNEPFFKPLKGMITNLKFRATYGIIGNDAIGSPDDRFFYLSNVNMDDESRRAIFGRDQTYILNGISISRYADPNITWETSTQKNFGMDLSIINRLNLTIEYYTQHRKHILMDRAAIPFEAGFAAPIRANVGAATGNGVDISLDYKQNFSNTFWASVMGNFTYAKSKFTKYEEPVYDEDYRTNVGQPINQLFGLIAERLFVDDEEAANSPYQNYGLYSGGDIKYLDVNRDGQITNADAVPIGFPTTPEITYGFGFSLGYKNFDFSSFFQGLAHESFWIDPTVTWPFANNNALLKPYADDHWSEDHRNVYALFPRLSQSVNNNDVQRSTWWMRNGSFLRVKQVEIGYTLSKKVMKKLHASTFRIYLNASNLFTFSHFDLWDPEMGGNGLGYPIQRVFNLGVNINLN